MSDRLNPKLTKRALATALPIGENGSLASHANEEDGASEASSAATSRSSASTNTSSSSSTPTMVIPFTNPRLHLLHNGNWIPKRFELGRHVPRTGIWNCCGHSEHFSLYCDSVELRASFQLMLAEEAQHAIDSKIFLNNRRGKLKEEVQQIQAEAATRGILPKALSADDQTILDACSPNNTFQAPMLISFILKHFYEEPTMLSALDLVWSHIQTADGCALMVKHDLFTALLRVHQSFLPHAEMQLKLIKILQQLVDCNYTRDDLIQSKTELLKMSFAVGHRFQTSADHVDHAARIVMHCSRSEVCRQVIFAEKMITYLLLFCKHFMKEDRILRSMLRLCNWSATSPDRLRVVYDLKAMRFALKAMQYHVRKADVTGPAIVFIRRIISNVPEGMEAVLQLNVPPVVIEAMKMLTGDAEVQLEALKLLKAISMTSEGWKQIDVVRGGWQDITTGTTLGNELVHLLPGSFQNPGWAIGETPYMPPLERQKLDAAEEAKNSLQIGPKAAWTPHALRGYMGLSMSGQTLAINTEYHNLFFELLVTLDLLPFPGEDKEDWFIRTRGFEKENDVSLDDMVGTIQEMRRREAIHKQNQAKNLSSAGGAQDEVLGSVKELYVNGAQVTTQSLQENDASLEEAMQLSMG